MDYAEDVVKYIKENIIKNRESAGIDKATMLFTAGVIDSFGIVELIAGLEQRYGISFVETDLTKENLESAEAIAKIIKRKKND